MIPTRHLVPTVALALSLALATSAWARVPEPVVGGTRVRVTILERAPGDSLVTRGFEPGDRIVGTLLEAGPRGLELARGGDPGDTLTIARELVAAFETSAGRRGHAGKGAAYGFLIGAAAGVGIGLYLDAVEKPSSDNFFGGRGAVPFFLGVGGAVTGLGVGTIVGSMIRSERWRQTPVPEPQ